MSLSSPRVIFDRTGEAALVVPEAPSGALLSIRLGSGQRIGLDRALVTPQGDGTATADVVFAELDPGPPDTFLDVEERLEVTRQTVEGGRVRVELRTETTEQTVNDTGWRESVRVERKPVGRPADRVDPPREVDGVTILPVYEEVLVVTRRLMLTEEIHLIRDREPVPTQHTVPLRTQSVHIERVPPLDSIPDPG